MVACGDDESVLALIIAMAAQLWMYSKSTVDFKWVNCTVYGIDLHKTALQKKVCAPCDAPSIPSPGLGLRLETISCPLTLDHSFMFFFALLATATPKPMRKGLNCSVITSDDWAVQTSLRWGKGVIDNFSHGSLAYQWEHANVLYPCTCEHRYICMNMLRLTIASLLSLLKLNSFVDHLFSSHRKKQAERTHSHWFSFHHCNSWDEAKSGVRSWGFGLDAPHGCQELGYFSCHHCCLKSAGAYIYPMQHILKCVFMMK